MSQRLESVVARPFILYGPCLHALRDRTEEQQLLGPRELPPLPLQLDSWTITIKDAEEAVLRLRPVATKCKLPRFCNATASKRLDRGPTAHQQSRSNHAHFISGHLRNS